MGKAILTRLEDAVEKSTEFWLEMDNGDRIQTCSSVIDDHYVVFLHGGSIGVLHDKEEAESKAYAEARGQFKRYVDAGIYKPEDLEYRTGR